MIVQCALLKSYTILGYSTETVLLIFLFLQTNITVQTKPSGGEVGCGADEVIYITVTDDRILFIFS